MKFDSRVRIGDIILERRHNWRGRIMSSLMPPTLLSWPSGKDSKRCSMHNAIFGICGDTEGVFETSSETALVFTPWRQYQQEVDTGKTDIKIARVIPPLSETEEKTLMKFLTASIKTGIPYDRLGALFSTFRSPFLKALFGLDRGKKWYCTELIEEAFLKINRDVCGVTLLPSPHTIEQAIRAGRLTEIADMYRN